jgi:hypothetical protein
VALTPKMVVDGSAKYTLTYNLSFDPILDPPLVGDHGRGRARTPSRGYNNVANVGG